MATEVSRNLNEINDSISKINNSLKSATKETNSLAKSLKLDPKNLRLGAEYAKSLQEKAKLAAEKVQLLKQKQEALKTAGVSETAEEYRKLTTQIVQAESEVTVLNKKIKETSQQKLDNLQSGLNGAAKVAKALLASLVAIGTAYVVMGDKIDKNSKKFGVSAEQYQLWANIFDKTLLNTGGYVTALNTMATLLGQVEKGSGKMFTALQTVLGVDPTMFAGMGTQQALETVLQMLGSIEDEEERLAAANAIFGSAGSDLAMIAGLTADEISELNAEMRAAGLVTESQAASAAKLQDKLDDLKNTFRAQILDLGDSLIPLFETLISLAKTFLPILGGFAKFLDFIGPVGQVILFAVIGLVAAMPALVALVKALTMASVALDTTLTALLSKFFIIFAILLAISALLNAIFGTSYDLNVDTSGLDEVVKGTDTVVGNGQVPGAGTTNNITYNDYSTNNVEAHTDIELEEIIDGLNNKVIQVGGK